MPAQCCEKFWKEKLEGRSDIPVFTIVGWDKLAVETCRFWLMRALESGVNSEKIQRGLNHLIAFEQYAAINPDFMKLPD